MPGIAVSKFDNSGSGPLLVPGFSGMPLYVEADVGKPRFAHAFEDEYHWPMRATGREIAMLRCMDKVTDRPNWHEDVFSDDKVSEWKEEAKSVDRRISDRAWAWCVLELRDKARRFIKTGRTVVFDYGSGGICKVDLLSHDELPSLLKRVVEEVVDTEPAKGRPRPNSVARIVDPHLAPLAYGQTRVLLDGGVVGLEDMDNWYGRGSPSARNEDMKFNPPSPIGAMGNPGEDAVFRRWDALGSLSPEFQWLPCEVAFTREDSPCQKRPKVQITSYINDLHPHKQASAYATIEKTIAAAIESWNDVLVLSHKLPIQEPLTGRTPARIKTYGVQYPFGLPSLEARFSEIKWPKDPDSTTPDAASQADLAANLRLVEEQVSKGMVGSRAQVYSNETPYASRYEPLSSLIQPEPGVSFSYQEWKTGRNVTHALVPRRNEEGPDIDHEYYSVSLQDEFRDRGLQVVVRIDSIELTPKRPSFKDKLAADEWRWKCKAWHAADGLVTDYIIATAILFFDLDNVDPISIQFQQAAHLYGVDFSEDEHRDFPSIEAVFDLQDQDHWDWRRDLCQPSAYPRVQELGGVIAREGRMISFPGPVSYCFDPIKLADASKPGRARYLALYLVDPNYRVCSTRNVPPQRQDWWAYDVARKAPEAFGRLPQELVDQIVANADTDVMLDTEGLVRVRDAMEKERLDNESTIRDDIGSYQFCYDMDCITPWEWLEERA